MIRATPSDLENGKSSLRGKGLLIERAWELAPEGAASFGRRISALNVDWVAIKLAHEVRAWPPVAAQSRVRSCVIELRARRIQVWGWSNIAGSAPAVELELAISALQEYELNGWVFEPHPSFSADLANPYPGRLKAVVPTAGTALFSREARYQGTEAAQAMTSAFDVQLIGVRSAGDLGLARTASQAGVGSIRTIPVFEIPSSGTAERHEAHHPVPNAGASKRQPRASMGDEGPAHRLLYRSLVDFLEASRYAKGDSALLSLDRILRSPACPSLLEAWKASASG